MKNFNPRVFFVFLVLFNLSPLYSQGSLDDVFGFEEGVADAPAAPIDMLIYAGLIAGSCMGIKRFGKKH